MSCFGTLWPSWSAISASRTLRESVSARSARCAAGFVRSITLMR